MVLLLAEADDPDAKLLPPTGPPVTRVTVEDGEGNGSDTDDEETVRLVQDPPPSYTDVQSFRIRAKSQEEEQSAGRARRRFWLAVGIALFLCSLPSILVISLTRSHTLEDITTPEPTTTDTTGRPLPTSQRPDHPGWGGGPGRPRERDPWEGNPWPRPGGGDHGEHGEGPGHGGHPRFPGDGRQRPEHPPGENPEEGELECSDWVGHYNPNSEGDGVSFVTNYTLSHTGPLFIRSFLTHASGNLRVSRDDQLSPDDAFVEITVKGVSQDNIKDVEACVDRRRGCLGLKARRPPAEAATYFVHLFLSSQRTGYPGLTVHLPRFSQAFDDLSFADFRFIGISGEDAEISAVSLSANWLNVHTTNGSIDGHFAAKRMLDISGSAGSITVTADICNNDQEYPTAARIMSSQGPIDARVVLCEPTRTPRTDFPDERPEQGGQYELFLTNSDSPISLKVEHSAPKQGSSIWMNITNSDVLSSGNSHTTVTLDTGFEGKFLLQSQGESSLPVSVKSEEATDDEGGVRYVEVEEVRENGRSVSGKVFWNSPAPPLDRRSSDVWISTAGGGEASLLLLGD